MTLVNLVFNRAKNEIIELHRDGAERKFKCVPFNFYFYLKEEHMHQIKGLPVKVEQTNTTTPDEHKLCKVIMPIVDFKVLMDFKNHYETYELDLSPEDRYAIDNDLVFTDKIKIFYIDIETLGSVDTVNVPQPVISITCYDNFTKKYMVFCWRSDFKSMTMTETENSKTIYYGSESDMLKHFALYISVNEPDLMTGWNFIRFDISYLINRMKVLGVNPNIIIPKTLKNLGDFWVDANITYDRSFIKLPGIILIDSLEAYKKANVYRFQNPHSYSLNSTAEFELNEHKKEIFSIEDSWKNDLNHLLEYNMTDVELVVKLQEYVSFFRILFDFQTIIGMPLDKSFFNSHIIDTILLKRFRDTVHFPSKSPKMHVDYPGAFVMEPSNGHFLNVAVIDFVSMYPNLMIGFNISNDAKDSNGDIVIDDVRFNSKKTGFLVDMIQMLLGKRFYYKGEAKKIRRVMNNETDTEKLKALKYQFDTARRKEDAHKALVNSCYGIFGYRNFRMFDPDIARSVAGMGRYLLKFVIDYINAERDFKALYGDTDSVFIQYIGSRTFEEAMSELLDRVNKEVAKYARTFNPSIPIDEKTGHCRLKMDMDYTYKALKLFGTKKRYIGIRVMDGKEILWARGVEMIRKDTPDIFRKYLNEFFIAYLNNPNASLKVLLRDIRKRIIANKNVVEFGIAKNFGMKIDDYTNNPQHVRALKWSNERLGLMVKDTDYVKMLFIKKTRKYDTDVMCYSNPAKIPVDIEIDYDKYFDFFILKKVDEILEIGDIRMKLMNLLEFIGGDSNVKVQIA